MPSQPSSKIKVSAATKRFNRYHPQHRFQFNDKVDLAESILLWEYLDLPKLYDPKLDDSINRENLETVYRQLKHLKIHIKQEHHYLDDCYFMLLSNIIEKVKVKKINAIGISQEVDFEANLDDSIKQLFNLCHHFSKLFFESPWRSLYPILDEHLKINGTSNYYELWEFLEADFKIRFGNLYLKDYRLSLRHYEENLAIIFIDYRTKSHTKSAPKLVQLKILFRYKLNVWQIAELFCEDFFQI
jgi:hypothetical protein